MKDNRLISMTDFVIQQRSELMFKELGKACCKYADFLKQPLKLEMFVPCDEDGNVLEEPKGWSNGECDIYDCCSICCCEQYKKAKENVLFEIEKYETGILNGKRAIWINDFAGQIIDDFKFLTIEDLVSKSFQLTSNAIKQIQL